jgi:predicted metal-dependent HD superfamily phosphohydrolase
MQNNILLCLTELYTRPERRYHNLQHIAAMLTGAPEPLSIEQTLAIWFHDAIYNPISTSNEEDSAELVTKLYDIDKLERIADPSLITDIILSTKKHQPLCKQAEIVLDLDLAILGTNPSAYKTYVENVKAEYTQHIPEEMFHSGRSQFLKSFLMRDILFFTAWGRNKFEAQARANLEAELAVYDTGTENEHE